MVAYSVSPVFMMSDKRITTATNEAEFTFAFANHLHAIEFVEQPMAVCQLRKV